LHDLVEIPTGIVGREQGRSERRLAGDRLSSFCRAIRGRAAHQTVKSTV